MMASQSNQFRNARKKGNSSSPRDKTRFLARPARALESVATQNGRRFRGFRHTHTQMRDDYS
jgi:hypothetical protein